MQYVGRFVSSVYNTITPNINPATLSGAIDVIVVEREVEVEEEVDEEEEMQRKDGKGESTSSGVDPPGKKKEKLKRKRWTTELASTPFHVRFGKMSVLRPGERKVTLHLNNSSEPLPFAMKVGEQGEAFFVVEIDEEQNTIPDDLVTSPILSASASPMASPGLQSADTRERSGQQGEVGNLYVEPLDLDDSRTTTAAPVGAGGYASPASDVEEAAESDADGKSASFTIATSATGDTEITSPSNSRSPSADKNRLQEYRPSGRPDPSDLDVPKDSGLAGSGPAGSSSLLNHLGHAASKAGGAIGAASRAVGVSASSNPKLEKLTRSSSRHSPGGRTGALVDEKKVEGHEFDPQQDTPSSKQRQQKADGGTPPQVGKKPLTETEKLEEIMRDKVDELINAEEDLLQSSYKEGGQNETTQARRSSLASQASIREESYPAPFGSRVETGKQSSPRGPVRSGSNTYPVSQADHAEYLAGRKLPEHVHSETGEIAPAQLDSRTIEGQIRSYKEARQELGGTKKPVNSSSGPADAKTDEVPDEEVASKKPVVPRSKEDLQYLLDMDGYKMTTDGEDLAFAEGHRLADELPLSRRHGGHERHPHIGEYLDTAHRRDLVSPKSQKGPESEQSEKPEGERVTLESLLSLRSDTPPLTSHGVNHNEIDIEFSQDLAAVARALFPPGQDTDHLDDLDDTPTLKRRPVRQDGSHSDGDVDDDDEEKDTSPSNANVLRSKSHLRAKSGPFDYSLSRMVPDSTTSHDHYDETLKSSAWSMDPGVQGPPRQRVLSSGAGDGVSNSHSEALELLRQQNSGPSFRAYEGDPYTFEVVLEGGCERHFAMSLCFKEGFGAAPSNPQQAEEGNAAAAYEGTGSEEARNDFEENRISFQRFVEDPDVVNDERLVVLYNDRYLTWENASAVLATLSLYRKTFASARGSEEEAVRTDEPVPSREHRASVWSRWWNRNRHLESDDDHRELRESSAPPEDNLARHLGATASSTSGTEVGPPPLERTQSDPILLSDSGAAQPPRTEQPPPQPPKGGPWKTYAKTLRLTSDQLKSLNLKKGANNITFSVTSSYSGVATCTARIFLWESKHHIVVSDIDGTITKSDALGHVFTMIGRDWTHLGVAKLYTDIARNGYRIMYLTSRAIGQAGTTRDYLRGINQNNYRLPDGPVIMSPDRLIASLHREVILRKPEVFKMACLRDIARLFGADSRHPQPQPGGAWPGADAEALKTAARNEVSTAQTTVTGATANPSGANPTPFYAGFGNRITDALSYRSVNIPSSRIFTIDSNGEVKMELLELAGYKSSYIHMTDLVDQMFPPITQQSSVRNAGKPEFSDFNYWRPSVGEFELPADEDLMPTPPVSPALSARSGRSVRSTASIRSGRGASGTTGGATSGAVSGGGNGGVGSSSSTFDADPQQSQGRLSRFGLSSLGLSRKPSAQTIAEAPQEASKKSHGGNGGGSGGGTTFGPGITESASAPDLQHSERSASASGSTSMEWSEGGGSGGGGSGGVGSSSWISSPWRRRTASPGPSGVHAGSPSSSFVMGTATGMTSPPQVTSPLVGPVLTADDPDTDGEEEDSEEECEEGEGDQYEEEEEYDDDDDDDDDVSSFESGEDEEEGEHSQSDSESRSGSEGSVVEEGAARRTSPVQVSPPMTTTSGQRRVAKTPRRGKTSSRTSRIDGQGRSQQESLQEGGRGRGRGAGEEEEEEEGRRAEGAGGGPTVQNHLEDDELLATGEVQFDWQG